LTGLEKIEDCGMEIKMNKNIIKQILYFCVKHKEQAVQKLFQEDAAQEYISAKRREQAIWQLLKEAEAATQYADMAQSQPLDKTDINSLNSVLTAKGEYMTYVSYLQQIYMQLKYMDKRLYLLQMSITCIAVLIANVFFAHSSNSTSIFSNIDSNIEGASTDIYLYVFIMLSSVAFSTVAMIACKIGDSHGMAELAGCCYFNHIQIYVLRMVLSGSMSLVSMGMLLCVLSPHVHSPIWQIGIYILVPYLVTGCFQFALLGITAVGRSQYVLLAGGMAMALMFCFIASYPAFYERTAVCIWFLIMILSLVILILEAVLLLKKIEERDLLCTN